MKQYAVVEIYTFESFVRGSIPKKNGEYTISVPDDWSGRINPHYLFGDGCKSFSVNYRLTNMIFIQGPTLMKFRNNCEL